MIGVFDSGIGGLTVLRALSAQLPDYDILYLGDTARAPYGSKSAETVSRFTFENIALMLHQGARLIVLACQSAAGAAMNRLQSNCAVPIFDTVAPAVATAVAQSRSLRIGVMADRTTVDCGLYPKMILESRPEARVFSAVCPLLVPLTEEGWVKKPLTRMIVKKYLHSLKVRRIDTLILGNPCYALFATVIQAKIGRRVRIVDAADSVSKHLGRYLAAHPDLNRTLPKSGRLRLVFTDLTPQVEKTAGSIMKQSLPLESTTDIHQLSA